MNTKSFFSKTTRKRKKTAVVCLEKETKRSRTASWIATQKRESGEVEAAAERLKTVCDKGEAGGVCFRGESRNSGSGLPRGRGLKTTQTTIVPDKSHICNCFRFEKWMSWLAFWLSGMWGFHFRGRLSGKIIQRLLQNHLAYSRGDIRSHRPSSLQSKQLPSVINWLLFFPLSQGEKLLHRRYWKNLKLSGWKGFSNKGFKECSLWSLGEFCGNVSGSGPQLFVHILERNEVRCSHKPEEVNVAQNSLVQSVYIFLIKWSKKVKGKKKEGQAVSFVDLIDINIVTFSPEFLVKTYSVHFRIQSFIQSWILTPASISVQFGDMSSKMSFLKALHLSTRQSIIVILEFNKKLLMFGSIYWSSSTRLNMH